MGTFSENCNHYICNFTQRNFLKNDDVVKESFNLPDPIFIKTECFTPDELKILKDVGLPEVINALNAGDKETALKLVGCDVKNEKNIVEKVLYKLNKELNDKTQKIEEKKNALQFIQLQIESEEIDSDSNEQIDNLKSK